jgi:hypothetical protein
MYVSVIVMLYSISYVVGIAGLGADAVTVLVRSQVEAISLCMVISSQLWSFILK